MSRADSLQSLGEEATTTKITDFPTLLFYIFFGGGGGGGGCVLIISVTVKQLEIPQCLKWGLSVSRVLRLMLRMKQ